MSAEREHLIAPSGQLTAPFWPPNPPPYYSEKPPYSGPPPIQHQPYPAYGYDPNNVIQTTTQVDVQTQESKPRNYIVLSLLTAICICPLCGCLALYFALQVNSAWTAGDREKARRSSKRAVRLSLAGIITIVLLVMGYLMSIVVAYSVAS